MERGTVCCVQHCPMKLHKKRRQCELHTNIAQVIKFHYISLVEKKIDSGAWGPLLCMTKTKNEIKMPYSIRRRGSPKKIKAHPEKQM